MNIFKKAAACLAAVTVMSSVAVTASADYQMSGIRAKADDKYLIRVVGLPETVLYYSNFEVVSTLLTFQNGDSEYDKAIVINVVRAEDYRIECYIMGNDGKDTADNNYGNLKCELLTFDGFGGKLGFMIWIPADNECLSDFIKYGTVDTMLMGGSYTNNGFETTFFNSSGEIMNYGYFEPGTITWEALNTSENPESAQSEPVSSGTSGYAEPETSAPTSSEPVSEPASSEPVSEPVSSETSTTQPSNVDTGAAGIAAVVGTAVLAAGAVIVARKKK